MLLNSIDSYSGQNQVDEITANRLSYQKQEGGRRFGNVAEKQYSRGQPLITIITATFNVVRSISETAESIRSQSYNNIEWVVIDGGSTDGTVEFLKQNEDVIGYWVSEADEGIYDAFNKGCNKATGDWVIFLGAGDKLFDVDVLKLIANRLAMVSDVTEIVYGKVAILGSNEKIVGIENSCLDKANSTWAERNPTMPHHQGVLHRKTLLSSDQPFDNNYSITADQKLVLGSFLRVPPVFIDIVISKAQLGGISSEPKFAFKAAIETIRVNLEIGCFYDNLPYQAWLLCKFSLKAGFAIFLPESASKRLIDKYRELTGRYKKWR